MTKMVKKNKWILYKHTCDYELIKAVALDVKNSCKSELSNYQKYQMQDRLKALNLYHTRNPETRPLDAINHRINTLEYWMFGYEDKILVKVLKTNEKYSIVTNYTSDELTELGYSATEIRNMPNIAIYDEILIN